MKTPQPFRFDGHGINDNDGQRIAKVTSCSPYEDGNKRNPEFDRLSNLFAAAPELLTALEETLQSLEEHLNCDTRDARLSHRDILCPCNSTTVVKAKEAIKKARGKV